MDVITVLASVFGFIALAGGAAGYFKASRGDSIIKYQTTELELRNEKIAGYEKDFAALKSTCDTKDGTIAELQKHNEYLQKLGQGSPELKRLADTQERLTKAIENQTILITEVLNKKPQRRKKSTHEN